MNIPKLYIQYAYPLDMDRRYLLEEKNLQYPSYEEIVARIAELKKLWEDVNAGDRVFRLLIELTGVTVPRDLEMYIIGGGLRPMSHPLLMPITGGDGKRYSDDECLETIIHEIIHRFVGQSESNEGIAAYWQVIREEYTDETRTTQNHIIVYALLEKILAEVVGRDSLEGFMKPPHPEYQKAAQIAKQKGEVHVIQQFRNFIK